MILNPTYFKIIDKNNYLNIKNDISKNKNQKLAHYSLTTKGNALYFQKIMMNKIFSIIGNKINTSKLQCYSFPINTRYLEFGGVFQYQYFYLSSFYQIKRNVTSTFFGNDVDSTHTFKSFMAKSNLRGNSDILKVNKEVKKSIAYKRHSIFLLSNLSSDHCSFYMNRVPSAKRTLSMRSKFSNNLYSASFIFKNEISFKKIQETIIKTLTNLNIFIRTIWYRSTLLLQNFLKPINFYEFHGSYRISASKIQYIKNYSASDQVNIFFTTLGSWDVKDFDLIKELSINNSNHIFRKYIKKYSRWRLGIVHWGKKVLNFKKNYLFWKYVRGLSHYYFRGFHMHSLFNYRADVYVLKTFNIKSLKMSRILISSGHIFSGTYPIKNVKTLILKFNLVSVSKKACNYISKKNINKYWNGGKKASKKKIFNRIVKSSPLKYCRQQKDYIFWGTIKNTRYSMFYGSDLNFLNSDFKKSRYFALNYFYLQKSVSTSWW